MARKIKSSPFRAEVFRAALVLGLSAVLGLAVNTFSANPLPIIVDKPATVPGTSDGAPADAQATRIAVADLVRAAADAAQVVRIVDVRGQAEFDTGHVPNAIHAPLETITKSRGEIDSLLQGATLIAVMCDSDDCPKAANSADALVAYGYKNVRVLTGGWEAYKASGHPIEEAKR